MISSSRNPQEAFLNQALLPCWCGEYEASMPSRYFSPKQREPLQFLPAANAIMGCIYHTSAHRHRSHADGKGGNMFLRLFQSQSISSSCAASSKKHRMSHFLQNVLRHVINLVPVAVHGSFFPLGDILFLLWEWACRPENQ